MFLWILQQLLSEFNGHRLSMPGIVNLCYEMFIMSNARFNISLDCLIKEEVLEMAYNVENV